MNATLTGSVKVGSLPGGDVPTSRDLPPAIKFRACGVTRSGYPDAKV